MQPDMNRRTAMREPWRVLRFDQWIDPVFDERLRATPGVVLDIAARRGDDARAWALLSHAQVYQLSPARDELPRHFHVDAALLARSPRLLCVSTTGAGYDTVDVAACTHAGVAVVNQAGGNARSVAEMAIGLMLAVSRRIAESDRRLRAERGFSRESLMGREISGKVLGLVGIGNAGTATARLASAFGMQVLACDPFVAPDEVRARGGEPVSLDELLARADFVSLHCPRDETTLGLIDAGRLAAMKRGAIFVSTARGGIHDEAALADALRAGHLAGAGLDVWAVEPPALDDPLLALPNVVATYHTAGVTHEARRMVASMAAEQVLGLMDGRQPPRLVDPAVWPAVRERLRARGAPA